MGLSIGSWHSVLEPLQSPPFLQSPSWQWPVLSHSSPVEQSASSQHSGAHWPLTMVWQGRGQTTTHSWSWHTSPTWHWSSVRQPGLHWPTSLEGLSHHIHPGHSPFHPSQSWCSLQPITQWPLLSQSWPVEQSASSQHSGAHWLSCHTWQGRVQFSHPFLHQSISSGQSRAGPYGYWSLSLK